MTFPDFDRIKMTDLFSIANPADSARQAFQALSSGPELQVSNSAGEAFASFAELVDRLNLNLPVVADAVAAVADFENVPATANNSSEQDGFFTGSQTESPSGSTLVEGMGSRITRQPPATDAVVPTLGTESAKHVESVESADPPVGQGRRSQPILPQAILNQQQSAAEASVRILDRGVAVQLPEQHMSKPTGRVDAPFLSKNPGETCYAAAPDPTVSEPSRASIRPSSESLASVDRDGSQAVAPERPLGIPATFNAIRPRAIPAHAVGPHSVNNLPIETRLFAPSHSSEFTPIEGERGHPSPHKLETSSSGIGSQKDRVSNVIEVVANPVGERFEQPEAIVANQYQAWPIEAAPVPLSMSPREPSQLSGEVKPKTEPAEMDRLPSTSLSAGGLAAPFKSDEPQERHLLPTSTTSDRFLQPIAKEQAEQGSRQKSLGQAVLRIETSDQHDAIRNRQSEIHLDSRQSAGREIFMASEIQRTPQPMEAAAEHVRQVGDGRQAEQGSGIQNWNQGGPARDRSMRQSVDPEVTQNPPTKPEVESSVEMPRSKVAEPNSSIDFVSQNDWHPNVKSAIDPWTALRPSVVTNAPQLDSQATERKHAVGYQPRRADEVVLEVGSQPQPVASLPDRVIAEKSSERSPDNSPPKRLAPIIENEGPVVTTSRVSRTDTFKLPDDDASTADTFNSPVMNTFANRSRLPGPMQPVSEIPQTSPNIVVPSVEASPADDFSRREETPAVAKFLPEDSQVGQSMDVELGSGTVEARQAWNVSGSQLSRVEIDQQTVTVGMLKQASSAIESLVQGDADGRGKSISIELHPAELGSLQIEVRQVADGWEAKIIAGRLGTGELLNAHREQLTASMQNLGMESIDLEISHQRDESPSSESGQSRQQQEPSQQRRYRTPEIELTNTPVKQDASMGLNIIA